MRIEVLFILVWGFFFVVSKSLKCIIFKKDIESNLLLFKKVWFWLLNSSDRNVNIEKVYKFRFKRK